ATKSSRTRAMSSRVMARGVRDRCLPKAIAEGAMVSQLRGSSPEASCGELDGGRPKSSMSHHFRVLRDAGLVCTYAVGTTRMNSLRAEEMESRFPGLLAAILGTR